MNSFNLKIISFYLKIMLVRREWFVESEFWIPIVERNDYWFFKIVCEKYYSPFLTQDRVSGIEGDPSWHEPSSSSRTEGAGPWRKNSVWRDRYEEIEKQRHERLLRRIFLRQLANQRIFKSMQMLQANARPEENEPFEDYGIFLYRQTAPDFKDRVKSLEDKLLFPVRLCGWTSFTFCMIATLIKSFFLILPCILWYFMSY